MIVTIGRFNCFTKPRQKAAVLLNSGLFAGKDREKGKKREQRLLFGGFQNTDGFLRIGNAIEHGVRNVLFVFGDEETRETVPA